MKKILVTLVLLFSIAGFAQQGKIYPKNKKIKRGEINTYTYEPPAGLEIPDEAWAIGQSDSYEVVSTKLVKKESTYEFSMKFSEKTNLVLVTINDKKSKAIDTNNYKGYAVKTNSKFSEDEMKLTEIAFWGFSAFDLGEEKYTQMQLDAYKEIMNSNSTQKDAAYFNYLIQTCYANPQKTKTEALKYIEKIKDQKDEKSLNQLMSIYNALGMEDEAKDVKKIIIEKNPKGQQAKYSFWDTFGKEPNKTEEYILNKEKEYKSLFSDYTEDDLFGFKYSLLEIYLKEKNIEKIEAIENHPVYKYKITHAYNSHAWELSGQDLIHPGTDLDFAERLSKKTLEIVKYQMENPDYESYSMGLNGTYNMFADTYALILYKQKRYQEAFEYQHQIALQDELDTGGKERYAGFAEKAKGLEFTKNYIEKELDLGTNSKLLTAQLERIYQELNLPKETLENKKQQLKKLVTENAKKEVVKLYGDVKAPDFELENLEGKKVKLSDLKGKIVVLDFWATWCGPCRASFPNMQKLVNDYKNHKVEFLFIDTWEGNQEEKVKNKVTEFLKDKNYTFNVLYDFTSEVSKQYKIKGIPAKIVIDKEGNVISVNSSEENIKELIEENK